MLGLILLAVAILIVLPVLVLVIVFVRLSNRIAALERELHSPTVAAPEPLRPPATADVPWVEPPLAPVAPRPALPPPPPLARPEAWHSEQVIGGTWLQNIGSVLVLLGVFFLFLWGYSTGRFGPGVLVVAGVAFGALLVWRGDRTIAGLPGFGHAIIGIGLGIAYLALYSGHFVLEVFGIAPAIGLLALASIASIAVGMRYRVQLIAVLGVIGAFIPWIAGTLTGALPASGSAGALLAYLVAVDAVVFFLAARAGWSGLALTTTLLTTTTWVATRWEGSWSLPVQLGLCGLYLGLGLSLVPRFLAGRAPRGSVDLAAVGVAPWAFAIASAPFLSDAPRATSTMILLGMAAAWGAAAFLVDERRPQRDLWSQFVVAASAFVAAALERALGETLTPLAWCVQGATLVALGLAPRAGALRASGYILLALGAAVGLPALYVADGGATVPVITPNSIRTAISIAAFLVVARLLERHRDFLLQGERDALPPAALTAAHASLALWLVVHAHRMATAVVPVATETELRALMAAALAALAWSAHGAGLVLGALRGRTWTRVIGYAIVAFAGGAFFLGAAALGIYATVEVPRRGNFAVGHVAAATLLLAFIPVLVMIERAVRARDRLAVGELGFLKFLTAASLVAGLLWSSSEASLLVRNFVGLRDVATIGAALTSAAWTVQAIAIFALGWFRGSPYLRWLGIGTLGLTILKFLLLDLARVDAFWRFVTAIAVGCVLLALSYVYQRARRRAGRGEATGGGPAEVPVEVAPGRGSPYAADTRRKDDA